VSTKTLLIILVLIAIVVGVAIWRGQRDQGKPNTAENRNTPPGRDFPLFKWLSGGGDTLAVARLVGCSRSGRTLTFSGTCNARIMAGGKRQSRFVLRATVGTVQACYGFTPGQIDSCDNGGRGDVTVGGKKFVATSDEAFLRFYCGQISGPCTVVVDTVTRH
jgi:hypothetical protein